MLRFNCPHCPVRLKVATTAARKKVTCPRCGRDLIVPITAQTGVRSVGLLPTCSRTPAAKSGVAHPRAWLIIAAAAGVPFSLAAAVALVVFIAIRIAGTPEVVPQPRPDDMPATTAPAPAPHRPRN